MHATVPLSIGQELQARLADGSVRGDERRQNILCPQVRCHGGLRVDRWRTTSVNRERVAPETAVEIESRPPSILESLLLRECRLPVEEQSRLVRCQSRYRIASTGSASAEAGVSSG